MLDFIMAFALGMSCGAYLVVRFMVPVAFEAGADQARREDAPPSPSIYHSEVNKDRTAREDRPCAE